MSQEQYPLLPILIVDDEKQVLLSYKMMLEYSGITNLLFVHDSRDVEGILDSRYIGVILLDLSMPYLSGTKLLPEIALKYPEIPVIIVTGTNELETAVDCMRSGAFDYMVKPVDSSRLITSIKRAIELGELRNEYSLLSEHMLTDTLEHPEAFSEIITNNPRMFSIFKYMESVAPTSKPVLVTGETGVGKELFPRAIHRLSGRSGEYVAVNVAGLDDTVFSDTLFGHVRGAFTGAEEARPGLIEKASGGTLFLDEIGDLNQMSQIKLLRLLQEAEYLPLGTDTPKHSFARIIAATNRDIDKLTSEGTFRNDLYYRLITHHIHVPGLRERPEDIPFLVDHFIERAAISLNKKIPTCPEELYTYLATYPFPGNVRELESMIFDAVSNHKSRMLSMDVFRERIRKMTDTHPIPYESPLDGNDAPLSLPSHRFPTIREATEYLVNEAMTRSGGNQTLAAGLLGISRPALNKRLRKAKDASRS